MAAPKKQSRCFYDLVHIANEITARYDLQAKEFLDFGEIRVIYQGITMNFKGILVALLGVFVSTAHGQVYKCTDSSGKVTYTESPCKKGGKNIGADRGSNSETEKAIARTSELKAQNSISAKEREIRDTDREIDNYREAMSRELAQLRAKKNYSSNNLAGATWESSISQEMEAVIRKYDVMISEAARRLTSLKAELTEEKKAKSGNEKPQ